MGYLVANSKGKYFVFDYHPIYDRKNDVWFYDTIYPNGNSQNGEFIDLPGYGFHKAGRKEEEKWATTLENYLLYKLFNYICKNKFKYIFFNKV